MTRPPWLNREVDLASLKDAGLAIRLTDPPYSHCGILFRTEGETVHLLHLAFHHRLERQPSAVDYEWVQLQLPPLRLESVAALCELIWRQHQKGDEIPYALRFLRSQFAPTGALLLGTTEHGLTCATFILAVLRGASVELLTVDQWPPRPDDESQQRFVLQILDRWKDVASEQERPALGKHIAAVQRESGCARFRPEEVVAAASFTSLPVPFADAETAGRALLGALMCEYQQACAASANPQSQRGSPS